MTNQTKAVAPGEVALRPRRGVPELIGIGLSAGLLLLVLLLVALTVVLPFVTGSQSYNILTRSMEPAYPPGTLVVVQPTDAEELRVGDTITFQVKPGEPTVVTHRIVAATASTNGQRSFTTMGDNNATADPEPVLEEQIRGRVWYAVPWIGVLSTARQDSILSVVIPIVGAVMIAYGLWQIVSWLVSRLRRRA